jgi:hypothetical protein
MGRHTPAGLSLLASVALRRSFERSYPGTKVDVESWLFWDFWPSDCLPGRGAIVVIVGEEPGVAVLPLVRLRSRRSPPNHSVRQLPDQPKRVHLVVVPSCREGQQLRLEGLALGCRP